MLAFNARASFATFQYLVAIVGLDALDSYLRGRLLPLRQVRAHEIIQRVPLQAILVEQSDPVLELRRRLAIDAWIHVPLAAALLAVPAYAVSLFIDLDSLARVAIQAMTLGSVALYSLPDLGNRTTGRQMPHTVARFNGIVGTILAVVTWWHPQ